MFSAPPLLVHLRGGRLGHTPIPLHICCITLHASAARRHHRQIGLAALRRASAHARSGDVTSASRLTRPPPPRPARTAAPSTAPVAHNPPPPLPRPPPRSQDSSGVSRDEMAAALMDVSEGRVPTDRIALRELARELTAWPALDEPISEPWGWVGQGGWVTGGRGGHMWGRQGGTSALLGGSAGASRQRLLEGLGTRQGCCCAC